MLSETPLLDILHEDDDLLVVNKPAGLVCHPTRDGELSSLIGRVRLYLSHAEGRLVNRLDRETSGRLTLRLAVRQPYDRDGVVHWLAARAVEGLEEVTDGVYRRTLRLPAETSEADLLAQVDALNADDTVDGILVQLPLPPQITEKRVLDRISPEKDVDGFHPISVGRL